MTDANPHDVRDRTFGDNHPADNDPADNDPDDNDPDDNDANAGVDGELVAHVRRFNRTVTQRVGALNDRYLGRDRPLGEARLLWEIGEAGCDVRTLRAVLGLDSGY